MTRVQRGGTLVVGLILLTLVTLLGLAGASGAHVERRLAQNEWFRENAASAASAGIEIAIQRIVTSPQLDAVPTTLSGNASGEHDRFETVTRFAGYELALPQPAGANLAGAHFEITSVGYAARRAVDRQRANVMLIVTAPGGAAPQACEPEAPAHCHRLGELTRVSWQRIAPD